jgi:hypothetical protein
MIVTAAIATNFHFDLVISFSSCPMVGRPPGGGFDQVGMRRTRSSAPKTLSSPQDSHL